MEEDGVVSEHGSTSGPFQRRYPPELRERADRMVFETASERGERVGAVTRVAGQLGIGPRVPAHVGPPGRGRRREADGADHRGARADEAARAGVSRELRRATEILKSRRFFAETLVGWGGSEDRLPIESIAAPLRILQGAD